MSLRECPFLYDIMGGSLKIRFSKCVNMVDRTTQLRNMWFGFLAFVIFLLSQVCL